MENNAGQDEESTHEESSSEQENEVTFKQAHVQKVFPSMFMPYI